MRPTKASPAARLLSVARAHVATLDAMRAPHGKVGAANASLLELVGVLLEVAAYEAAGGRLADAEGDLRARAADYVLAVAAVRLLPRADAASHDELKAAKAREEASLREVLR